MAAQGHFSVRAVTRKPSGTRLMKSVWLIQQTLSAGTSLKSALSPVFRRVLPYSPALSAAETSPPAIYAASCAP